MSFLDSIGSTISSAVDKVTGAFNTVKKNVSGEPVPMNETAPVQPPLTNGGGRKRSKKTRKGGKRRTTRKNVSRR